MKINLLILSVFVVCSAELISVNGQSSDGSCGPTGKNQNCGTSLCCSQYGYCGSSTDYCGAKCQTGFGKCGTTSSTTAKSTSTTKTASTPSSTPVKAVDITTCKTPGTVAITFDDGPSEFTHTLLDSLKAKKVKATFFVNGNNYGCIYDYADILLRAKNEGHQIASHTWAHLDLATLTKDKIKYQMTKLEEAFTKILGVVPKYMRPPFGSGVDKPLVMSTLGELGYNVVTWDTDTNDWQGKSTSECLSVYKEATAPPNSHIVLNHDTVKNTATTMAPQAFQIMKDRGFKITTVAECLGVTDPNQWYKTVGAPQKRDKTWVCSASDVNGP